MTDLRRGVYPSVTVRVFLRDALALRQAEVGSAVPVWSVAALTGVDVVVAHTSSAADTCSSTTVANGDVEAVTERSKSIIGTTYDFGGGSMDGPGPGGIDYSAFVGIPRIPPGTG